MNNGPVAHIDEPETRTSARAGSSATRQKSAWTARPAVSPARRAAADFSHGEHDAPFDMWSLVQPVLRSWYWLIVAGGSLAAAAALIGLTFWHTTYTCSAQLIRYDPPVAEGAFKPQTVATPTLVSLIQAHDLMQKVGTQLHPPLTAKELARQLTITPERNTDIVTVTATSDDPQTVTDIANTFCREAIKFTQEMQRSEASEADGYVSQQLDQTEGDIAAARKKIPATVQMSLQPSLSAPGPYEKLSEKIQEAREELANLLLRYTEAHPLVKEQRAKLAALAAQMGGETSPQNPASPAGAALLQNAPVNRPAAADPAGLTAPVPSPQSSEIVFEQLRMLETTHEQLVSRQRTIQPFKISPPGYFRILIPAAADQAAVNRPWLKIGLCAFLFGMLGMVVASGEIILRELTDNRLKTAADVVRVTRLPLLATLGNLRRMSTFAQETWAFRTWIALQNRLGFSPDGLICGITSSRPGEGRSTWLRLLGRAAAQRGLRVLTITVPPTVETDPGAGHGDSTEALVLSAPLEVSEKFLGAEAQSIVNVSLPCWIWTLERRKQLQAALSAWRQIGNIVILLELPPASAPETVLLAEILPNTLWLVESGRPDAAATREQLQTLQNAQCHIVGAALNRLPRSLLKKRFVRWAGHLATLFFALLVLAPRGLAATAENDRETSVDAAQPTLSAETPEQRAPWQQRLTLGPGDLLNLSLFGQPELARENVPIGPDGRINYLEAQNVVAAGLTVDELRERLNDELAKFRRTPQVIVTPVAYRSKKYFVLGKVEQSGVFMLDRPTTIIEAVARARGLETGFVNHNLVDLADLSRAFLARQGKHMPVDFERLFLQGDLSQNIQLEPGDYLYFPAASVKEVYVLGEVRYPGPMSYTQDVNAIAAIAGRGGFTERAWRGRVLVVRGSLNNPQTFVIDIAAALKGEAANLQLQPKDIVYVSSRPWIRAEELLDTAASAFVEAATVTATGLHVTTNLR